ncbi:MAG: glycoside hydrolase family 88 protein [Acidobacteriota bacterium]|nr:glycoside hydrolase family 88 protein [Acidobacteriota bacterium]
MDTTAATHAQSNFLSVKVANAAMQRWPNGHIASAGQTNQWNYPLGILLQGMDAVWFNTADPRFYHYVKDSVDSFVDKDGTIATYDANRSSLEQILLGRQLLELYGVTEKENYFLAAKKLHDQLIAQPKTSGGGFWRSKSATNQMGLGDMYMAGPFLAQYAATFQQPSDFDLVTRQFVLMDKHARDPESGLLYHAWDQDKKQAWADKITGHSPTLWSRSNGWYLMALVDTLPYYPANNPGRAKLLEILQQTAAAVARAQDPHSGLWYQVLDRPGDKGNYLESSSSSMFTYAFEKAIRLGYLPRRYQANADRAWTGIQKHFVQSGPADSLTLTDTAPSVGLGGSSNVKGSYADYTSAPALTNDPKGVGAFLLASTEMENAKDGFKGLGKTILLDAWYNSQTHKNAAGQNVLYHYKWNDLSNNGYWLLGRMFRNRGVKTETLTTAPTTEKLKEADFYLIVSPDNTAKNPHPHYMTETDAAQIAAWVHNGGILILMENDRDNADIPHLDLLADKFGLHFNNVLTHHVIGRQHDMGKMLLTKPEGFFTQPHQLFMKDTCSLTLSGNAKPLLTWNGDILMATARYGKGTVVAVTDPWIYNEYTDGRNLEKGYDNFAGGQEFIHWLLQQP